MGPIYIFFGMYWSIQSGGPLVFLTTGQAHVTTELGHGCCGLNNPEVGRWFFLTTGLASIGGLLVSFNNWARVLQKKKKSKSMHFKGIEPGNQSFNVRRFNHCTTIILLSARGKPFYL